MGPVCKQRRMGPNSVADKKCQSEVNWWFPETSDCKWSLPAIFLRLTEFCQVKSKENLPFYNSYTFLKKVDNVLIGPEWKCSIVNITRDRLDEDRNTMNEQLELWHCDPIDCMKGLIGNPAFKDYISYVPKHVYIDDEGKIRIFDKMWTGDWWWDTQVWLFYKDIEK